MGSRRTRAMAHDAEDQLQAGVEANVRWSMRQVMATLEA